MFNISNKVDEIYSLKCDGSVTEFDIEQILRDAIDVGIKFAIDKRCNTFGDLVEMARSEIDYDTD